jgi:metallo-beta-lactamase family protein
MELEFSGAAREVTGSCHLLRAASQRLVVDCGLFQGHRHEADIKNRQLPLAIEAINAVVLSHAHLDHTGRVPLLVRNGYRGPVFCTPATRDLAAVLWADSANIQESDAAFLARRARSYVEPLYDMRDVARSLPLVRPVPYDTWFDVAPGLRARFRDAGHILGSASITVDATEAGQGRRIVFSGDIGRKGVPVLRDPQPPTDGADLVVMESTYGDRDHGSVANARTRLGEIVRQTADRGGRVLIPAFALGRAQDLIYDLHSLAHAGSIPRVPIIVDSPLATEVTRVYEAHPELFDATEPLVREVPALFRFDLLHFTRDVEESKRLNTASGPMVIIAGSGMAESGRILHHLLHGAGDPRNTIVIVGFQAQHTLGRRILERRQTLRIFDEEVVLRAHVEELSGYSAHADRTELEEWLDAVRAGAPHLARVCLVHGEPPAQDAFAQRLTAAGYAVRCPHPGDRLPLETP